MPPNKIVYWDACIFIAWLKNEDRPAGEMDGIIECVEKIKSKEVQLITSVMTKTEVLECDLSHDVAEKYIKLLSRRNVVLLDNDLRVSEIARKIREYYIKQKKVDGLDSLSTTDATHLATAIHYNADCFYTFDQGKKSPKGRSLLALDGNVAGYNLHVCKPVAQQFRLFL